MQKAVDSVHILEKIDHLAAEITEQHLNHLEAARRYSEMLAQVVALRTEVNANAEASPKVADLVRESLLPVPAVVKPDAELMARNARKPAKPGRIRRHTYRNVALQVG